MWGPLKHISLSAPCWMLTNWPLTIPKQASSQCQSHVSLCWALCGKANCLQKEAGTLRKYLDKARHYFSLQNGFICILGTQHMLTHLVFPEDWDLQNTAEGFSKSSYIINEQGEQLRVFFFTCITQVEGDWKDAMPCDKIGSTLIIIGL